VHEEGSSSRQYTITLTAVSGGTGSGGVEANSGSVGFGESTSVVDSMGNHGRAERGAQEGTTRGPSGSSDTLPTARQLTGSGSQPLPTTLPTATTHIDYNQQSYTGTIPTQVPRRRRRMFTHAFLTDLWTDLYVTDNQQTWDLLTDACSHPLSTPPSHLLILSLGCSLQ
jgi:hypothetical protein